MLRLRQFFMTKTLFYHVFVPVIIMIICYAIIGIYPGSKLTVMAGDSFSQFSNFHASFRRVLIEGDSLFYTWYSALGLNYLGTDFLLFRRYFYSFSFVST